MLNVNLSLLLLFKTLNIILENITRGATLLVAEFGCRSGPRESQSGSFGVESVRVWTSLWPSVSEFGYSLAPSVPETGCRFHSDY